MPVCVTAVLCFMYLTVPLCQLRLYGFVTLCEWVCMAVVCVCVCVKCVLLHSGQMNHLDHVYLKCT